MTIRESIENKEKQILSPRASLSAHSRGRSKKEPECSLRTVYQRDRDRIIHSKAFRRLKHKTQVFLSPSGDHYRTRLTHTLEVSQIARTVSRSLSLNEDLTEAIALAHDLGHTPFGHAGEEVLDQLVPGGFRHNEQSLRIIDHLEKGGKGLNLTWEVRDGVLNHSKGKGNILPEERDDKAATVEGQVVRAADVIAYICHDLEDAIRGGLMTEAEVPSFCLKVLGTSSSQRINTMVLDLVSRSLREPLPNLAFSPEVLQAMVELREFLYERVYEASRVHEDFIKARKVIEELYDILLSDADRLKKSLKLPIDGKGELSQRVCDFIAGMTDRYALSLYEKIFLPKPWAVL